MTYFPTPMASGATTAEKLRGTNVWVLTPGRVRPASSQRPGLGWVREGVASSRCGGQGCHPRKFLKTHAKSCILVASALISGLRGRVYPSKQQACQGLNQFQNFNSPAVVAPLVDRTKNQSNGNYETCKLHATRHLGT